MANFLDETGLATLCGLIHTKYDGKAQIATGSYVGTGTYDSANPCSLTFGFVPSIVAVYASSSAGSISNLSIFNPNNMYSVTWILPMSAVTTEYIQNGGIGACYNDGTSSYPYGKKSSDAKTVYWYNRTANSQFNVSGTTYHYFAFN